MNLYKSRKKYSSLNLISQLWKLISLKRKRQLFFLLIIIIFSGLSEIVTIASFIPFITALSNPSELLGNKFIKYIAELTNTYENNSLIILTTFIFIVFIIFSTITRLINIWLNYKMTAKISI